VLREAETAAARYGEVVLTGIHLGSYGYDISPQVLLPDLAKRLLAVGVKRVRLSSLEIREVTDDLIEAMEDHRICDHLHIPLQSGSDRVLRRMNRGYTGKAYRSGIDRIISRYPDISIGSDVITGFPGETDDEFEETFELIRDLPLSYLHVFPFSSRPGTAAASMPDHVDHVTKKARTDRLIALSSEKKTQFMRKQVGRTLELLLEERLEEGLYRGTTANFLKARAVFTKAELRSLAAVRVAGIERGELIAVPI
jgi:threonylcarbamoyladenosine tRNA methylthiotransferase MtaB